MHDIDNPNTNIPKADISENPPKSSHFRLTKPSFTLDNHSKLSYVLHGAVALVVGISVMSFLTQGALVLKDMVFSNSSAIAESETDANALAVAAANRALSNGAAGNNANGVNASQNRGLGSDDDVSGASGAAVNGSSSNLIEGNPYADEYSLADGANFPKLSARSYLAADLQTGEIILEQNEGLVAPMASVSKLMTAVISIENLDMQKIATVSRDAYNTFGSEGELLLGEKIKVYDLMHPLLMESSNDGAEVLSETYDKGRDAFMALMNKKAAELGMHDTYYEDPSGLNPKNVSSVEDLLKLGRYIYQKYPQIFDMTHVRQYSILKHTWANQNRFLNYSEFIGGKNGFIDEAKKTTVSLFNVTMARGGTHPVVIVLLKSDDREGDAVKIMNFLKKNAYYQESSTSTQAAQ